MTNNSSLMASPSSADPVLSVQDLSVSLPVRGSLLEAVGEVSFDLRRGQIRGLVGESGCGKSITATALMGLLPPGSTTTGRADLEGDDLLGLSRAAREQRNGRKLAMIFQEPMTALHPMLTVGYQVAEGMRKHLGVGKREARERGIEFLHRVGIGSPARIWSSHSHELSGGMRQRVMIAMMLACEPEVLIADEPTTALDVTIQAQILDLLQELVQDSGTAMLLITHDLGVVAEHCDDVTVMYAGRVIEQGSVQQVIHAPKHPYTVGLLKARPNREVRTQKLESIPGRVPTLDMMPSGCRFAPRCPRAQDTCAEEPGLLPQGHEHQYRCWYPVEEGVTK
jgi:peptide/nickel transport system ATP-binding protein